MSPPNSRAISEKVLKQHQGRRELQHLLKQALIGTKFFDKSTPRIQVMPLPHLLALFGTALPSKFHT
ncbi:hypothetical protein RJ641_004576 [Dillenia turbinata]|uniref:Uncharacterized protein n=1 Tax=Dillenia turbinata TaxID=194707 RepID=A0AAN8ZA83_9MAGN